MVRSTSTWLCLTLAAAGAATWASPATAQTSPGVTAPGQIERNFEQRLPERRDAGIELPAPASLATPSNASSLKFVLTGIEVNGATAVPADEVAATYAGLIGHEVTLDRVYAAAAAITALYVKHGYAISFATVPAQTIGPDGRARIDVIEGYVSQIVLAGDVTAAPPAIRRYARAIQASKPLRTDQLERYLLLMNDVPGFTVRSVFRHPSQNQRGATQLVLDIARKKGAGELSVDNRGSDSLGPWEGGAAASAFDLFGDGAALDVRVVQTAPISELNYQFARLSAPIGGKGMTLALEASHSGSQPGAPLLRAVNFNSLGWIGRAKVEYPIKRSRRDSVWLSGSFSARRFDTDLAATPSSRDRVYTLTLELDRTLRDTSGFTTLSVAAVRGLGAFDATSATSPLRDRVAGSGEYSALTFDARRLQHLSSAVDLYAAGSVQIASRGLLSSEQCTYGGSAYGRAFDGGYLAGDNCAQASAELRYNTSGPAQSKVQAYAFADAARVGLKGALLPGEVRIRHAASAGAGLRVSFAQGLLASAEWTRPVSGGPGGSDRVFVSISKGF